MYIPTLPAPCGRSRFSISFRGIVFINQFVTINVESLNLNNLSTSVRTKEFEKERSYFLFTDKLNFIPFASACNSAYIRGTEESGTNYSAIYKQVTHERKLRV